MVPGGVDHVDGVVGDAPVDGVEHPLVLDPGRLGLLLDRDVASAGVDQLPLGIADDQPRQPAVAAVLVPIAVAEMCRAVTGVGGDGLDPGGLFVVGMDEVGHRDREKVLDRVAEGGYPGRVDCLEVAVEADDAEHGEAHFIEPLPAFGDDRLDHGHRRMSHRRGPFHTELNNRALITRAITGNRFESRCRRSLLSVRTRLPGLGAPSVRIAVGYNPGRRGEALTCRLLLFFEANLKEKRRHEQAQAGRDREAPGQEEEAEGAGSRGEVVSSTLPAV